jgi:hypothetical protein
MGLFDAGLKVPQGRLNVAQGCAVWIFSAVPAGLNHVFSLPRADVLGLEFLHISELRTGRRKTFLPYLGQRTA